jgi:hypothetical protein
LLLKVDILPKNENNEIDIDFDVKILVHLNHIKELEELQDLINELGLLMNLFNMTILNLQQK